MSWAANNNGSWQWEDGDWGSELWKDYSVSVNEELMRVHHRDGATSHTITLGGQQYRCDFAALQQTKLSTQYRRRMRFRGPAVWQWNDDGTWKDYSPDVNTKLEAEYGKDANAIVFFTAHAQNYRADLGRNMQQNTATQNERFIRRQVQVPQPIWQWGDDDGWKDYDIDVSKHLERIHAS